MASIKCWRKKCPTCKKVVAMRKDQIYCKKRCSAVGVAEHQTQSFKRRRAQAGGQASGEVRRQARLKKYRQLIEKYGAEEACVKAYLIGYAAGHRARRYYEYSELRKMANHVIPTAATTEGAEVVEQ